MKLSCPNIVCFGRYQNKLDNIQKLNIKTKIGITENSSDNRSFDLVVDATGNTSGFSDAMKLVKPQGTVVLKSTIASKENLDLTLTIINEITLVGSRCGLFKPAINALASGLVSVDSLIDSTFSLEDLEDAIDHAKKPDSLKVFLKP